MYCQLFFFHLFGKNNQANILSTHYEWIHTINQLEKSSILSLKKLFMHVTMRSKSQQYLLKARLPNTEFWLVHAFHWFSLNDKIKVFGNTSINIGYKMKFLSHFIQKMYIVFFGFLTKKRGYSYYLFFTHPLVYKAQFFV